jgi:hypothetical protein
VDVLWRRSCLPPWCAGCVLLIFDCLTVSFVSLTNRFDFGSYGESIFFRRLRDAVAAASRCIFFGDCALQLLQVDVVRRESRSSQAPLYKGGYLFSHAIIFT